VDNVNNFKRTYSPFPQGGTLNNPQILSLGAKCTERALKESAASGMLSYPHNTPMVKKE